MNKPPFDKARRIEFPEGLIGVGDSISQMAELPEGSVDMVFADAEGRSASAKQLKGRRGR
jgi:predicted O-methyltransferase YrrM